MKKVISLLNLSAPLNSNDEVKGLFLQASSSSNQF